MRDNARLQEVEPGRNYIAGVPPEKLGETILARLVPVLETVLHDRHDNTLESIILDLYRGETQLWVVNDFQAVIITRIIARPKYPVLSIDWLAGEGFKDWIDDWLAIQTAFAKARDCAIVEFVTARRCEKAVARFCESFRPQYVIYRQDVR